VTLVWQGKLTKNRLSNRLRLRLTVVIGIPNFVDKLLLDFKSPFGTSNNFNNFLSKADKLVAGLSAPADIFYSKQKSNIYNVFFCSK
jgi:hypothetical protein